MKKFFTIALLLSYIVVVMAQDVPRSFPRKFLLEHFTTEQCGYCPYGMYFITNYLQGQEEQYIWVSHHSGFGTDEYTIPANDSIGNLVGADSAPNVALNRVKHNAPEEYIYSFHPGYLPNIAISDDKTAEASVHIAHTYDADTRQLHVDVSGQVANNNWRELLVTVLIKESNLVGKQAEYVFSFTQGIWKEYLHTRVVRDVLTNALGNVVGVADNAYHYAIDCVLDEAWKAEDCSIVAYITPLSKAPIINAEQVALVAGTEGGEQYYPWGITESSRPANPEKLTFDAVKTRKVSDTQLEVMLVSNKVVESNIYTSDHQMVALLYVNTTEDTPPIGLIEIQSDNATGTISAGYPNNEEMKWYGSHMAYAFVETITEDMDVDALEYAHVWALKSGKVLFEENGNITMAGNFRNGTHFTAFYTAPATAVEDIRTPANGIQKMLEDGQVIIRHGEQEYTILGERR